LLFRRGLCAGVRRLAAVQHSSTPASEQQTSTQAHKKLTFRAQTAEQHTESVPTASQQRPNSSPAYKQHTNSVQTAYKLVPQAGVHASTPASEQQTSTQAHKEFTFRAQTAEQLTESVQQRPNSSPERLAPTDLRSTFILLELDRLLTTDRRPEVWQKFNAPRADSFTHIHPANVCKR